MNQRLSIKQNIGQKIVLAFAIWLILSLPGLIGLFEYLLIRSHFVFIVLLQRAFHFSLCLWTVTYFLRDKIILEFNEMELIVINKPQAQETRIPFNKIIKLSLKPKYSSFTINNSYNYEIHFLEDNGLGANLRFRANPGRKLNAFIGLVEKNNPEFVFQNQTWY